MKRSAIPVLRHTLTFFFFLFVLNFIMINDFAIMGVQNQTIEEIVKNEFLSTIILTLLSHLLIYVILALISNFFLKLLFYLSPALLSHRLKTIYGFLVITHLSILHYSIIKRPQLIDEVIQNYSLIRYYTYFITDNFSPYLFLIPFIILFLWIAYRIIFLGKIKYLAFPLIFFIIFFGLQIVGNNVRFKNNRPNILLLAADSYRLDDAGNLKMFEKVSPFGKLLSFHNVKSVLPRTFPAWTSILTGVYPQKHHIYNMFPKKKQRALSQLRPLPLLLKENGYKTFAISDFAGDIFSRIDYGFEKIYAPNFNFDILIQQRILEIQVNLLTYLMNPVGYTLFTYLRGFAKFPCADILTNEAIQIIKNTSEPYFITMFYSDPHFPYSAVYPYYRINDNYAGLYKYMKNQTVSKTVIPLNDQTHIRGLFYATEKCVKDNIDELIDVLIETGQINNTIIAFLSDHGENVFDYGGIMGHGDHLYDETTITIPFYLFLPEKYVQGVQINKYQLAANIDLYPTLVDAAKLGNVDKIDGQNLFNPDTNRVIFMETGLWFVNNNGEFYQDERIIYPDLTRLLEIEWGNNNEPALKEDYLPLTERAKHRAICYKDYKLLYIPLEDEVVWKLFRNGKSLPLEENHELVNSLKNEFFKHYKPYFKINFEYLHLK